MPRQYVIANWKMNLPAEGLGPYIDAVASATGPPTTVVAPPFPYLAEGVRLASGRLAVGAQNCADHEKGAYTGEVSAQMVRESGAEFVIIGHSERRNLYGESDSLIARKLTMAIATGLVPVLCIGEDIRTREAGEVSIFLANQIRVAATAGLDGAAEIIIAYEPVWAIGTGRNASGTMVAETVQPIREALKRFWPSRYATEAPILYGGSVTPENVVDLVTAGHIDGFLVGGASLESRRFLAIRQALTAR